MTNVIQKNLVNVIILQQGMKLLMILHLVNVDLKMIKFVLLLIMSDLRNVFQGNLLVKLSVGKLNVRQQQKQLIIPNAIKMVFSVPLTIHVYLIFQESPVMMFRPREIPANVIQKMIKIVVLVKNVIQNYQRVLHREDLREFQLLINVHLNQKQITVILVILITLVV